MQKQKEIKTEPIQSQITSEIEVEHSYKLAPKNTNDAQVQRSKQFSQIVIENLQENQDEHKQSNNNIDFLPIQNEEQITKSQLQNYDKMMYHWRKIQRQSFKKNNAQIISKKPAYDEKNQIFAKYSEEIHNYLRAKFIYEEIVQPIHIQNMLQNKQITELQFMYLISFRAWCEINKAKQKFKQYGKNVDESQSIQNSTFKKYDIKINQKDKNIVYLAEPIFKMGEKVQSIFDLYHKALTFKEKSFMNRLRNLKDYLFHYRAKSERDKFLCGFEGVDFNQKQQIQYTFKYVPQIHKKLAASPKTKSANKIIPKIMNYPQIVSTFLQRIEGFDDFDMMKNTIIKQWRAKNQQSEDSKQKGGL